MIEVQISPSLPFGCGQPPEYRMVCFKMLRAPKPINNRLELFGVTFELSRLCTAAAFLIHLGASRNSVRPRSRRVQRDPLDERTLHEIHLRTYPPFAKSNQKGIVEVTNHLVRTHLPPHSRCFGPYFVQPAEESSDIAWV